ncbi:hypothetical protein OQA88_2277 [Cercophora sp. LCS_1]
MEPSAPSPSNSESDRVPQLPRLPQQAQVAQQSERWTSVTTPPPTSRPNLSPQSSIASTFTFSAASPEIERYETYQGMQYGSQYGYTIPGLGLGIAPPQVTQGHRRLLSQDSVTHTSPRHSLTARTPYQSNYQSNDYLLGDPSPPTQPLQSDYSPYGHQSSPPPPDAPRKRGRWNCGWEWTNSAWIMYGLLVFGIACAASHHVFYNHLAGKPAEDQLRMMRFGTLFAYVTKSSLVSAVVFAHRQQIWSTVRRKSLKLRTIDDLFAAADDLRALASWELVKKARVALALAILVWLYPLTVILTPATLTVAPLTEVEHTLCGSVRTLNFDHERAKNWRDYEKINGYPKLSLSLYNSTLANSLEVRAPFNSTYFDYWTSYSATPELVSRMSTYGNRVVPRENVSAETCGTGWNCSYVLNFVAPGYKCEEIARGRDNRVNFGAMGAPFNTSVLIPDGPNSYFVHATLGDYSPIQIDADIGGVPNMPPPFPKNLGAFRHEPVLWIGYADRSDWSSPPPLNDSFADWNSSFVPVMMKCEHYVTNYTVQFNHTYSDQVTKVLKKTYVRPIVNTTYLPGVDANDGTRDNTTATPESNYVLPLNLGEYRLTGAYRSLGMQMRDFINGSIAYFPGPYASNPKILQTRLIDRTNYLVTQNFMNEVESYYEDMIFSLLSNPQLLVVSWAARPDQSSGIASPAQNTDPNLKYACTKTRTINAYAYNARDLWIVYALAILCATASVFFGALALAENNNYARDTRVSSIIAATRAPGLEDLPWTMSKWGEVPQEIRDTKMGYGMIADDTAANTTTEQLEGQQKPMYGFAPVEVLHTNDGDTTGMSPRDRKGSWITQRVRISRQTL